MSKLSDFIDGLDLSVEQTYRGNCPVCNGRNTFTATRELGNILYNCYKNSCGISGAKQKNMDAQTIMELLSKKSREGCSEQDLCRYELPIYVLPYNMVEDPIDPNFLQRYGINPRDVYYDIRQDRLVFPVYADNNLLVDAVGRALNSRQPKWLRYAASPMPYVHGYGATTVVIVEDAISAYVVGEHFKAKCTGLALLGTQLTEYHKQYVKAYANIIVALDPDARDKTVKIARELEGKALNLRDDLKYKCEDDLDNLEEMLYAS